MWTVNVDIDIDGKLVNGLVGRVTEFKYLNNSVSVVYWNLMMTWQVSGKAVRCGSSTT